MSKYLTNNFSIINLHKKPSLSTEVVTQMIYGESFSILKETKKWLKIKIKEDGYKGYIKNKKFLSFSKATHKIHALKAKIYKFPNFRKKIYELPFCSKIKVIDRNSNFLRFSKGWISKKDVVPVNHKEKNLFRKVLFFKNIKYKWGGKSFKGIDCSALIQLFLNYNNRFCPRDAKDQVKYFKKNIKLNKIKKDDIIYWKGHVALAISNKKLIHAYGPMKKTVIMGINEAINRIEKTAKLKVIGIKRV
jgi:cell wall-associated NlpC family hydrolase